MNLNKLFVVVSSVGLVGLAVAMNWTKDVREQPVGMTFLFLNKGHEFIVVRRFDPDGQRGPVPGGLGASQNEKWGGAQMSFMPGDSQRPVPQWIEAEWVEYSAEFKVWAEREEKLPQETAYTKERREEYAKAWATNPVFVRRVDLTGILTPEIIARARKNPKTTNVKLKVIFKDDQVSITAENEVWR